MKFKNINVLLVGVLAMAMPIQSCSDWIEPVAIGNQTEHPWESDPEIWDRYSRAVREYKGREHFIFYASFENAMDKGDGERNYFRNLPDSLDYISLTNAGHFSKADQEDMDWVHQYGTKVLYHIDYMAHRTELTDEASLTAFLDKEMAQAEKFAFDGFSFNGLPDYSGTDPMSEKAAEILVKRLDQEGKDLVFEGNPRFLRAEDKDRIDLFVLDTKGKEYELDVKMLVDDAREMGIAPDKILLSSAFGSKMTTSSLKEVDHLDQILSMVRSQGPAGGAAIFNVMADYYHPGKNYSGLRSSIQKLNPAK